MKLYWCRAGGQPEPMHEHEQVAFKFSDAERDLSIYIVIEGYDNGKQLAEFAVQKMVYELYHEGTTISATLYVTIRRAIDS